MSYGIERQYTLQELADFAGVSIRTVRYYIGEGLLPVPAGAGPQSHYTESHALRLQAIGLLKQRFLPLREIRRALAGLDDAEVARLIDEYGGAALQLESRAAAAPISAPMDSELPAFYDAAEYIDTVLSERPPRQHARSNRSQSSPSGSRIDESWRRIEVADGVELLVRDDVYRRRQDQLDWLIDWARKVID